MKISFLAAILCLQFFAIAEKSFAQSSYEPVPNPLNGDYIVVTTGCGADEKPADPASPTLSIGLGKLDGSLVFSYGENGNGDYGLWFFKESPSGDYVSSFTLSGRDFKGDILMKFADGFEKRFHSELRTVGSDRFELTELIEEGSKNETVKSAKACRKLQLRNVHGD